MTRPTFSSLIHSVMVMTMNNSYPEVLAEIEKIVWSTESDIAKVHAIQGLLYSWDQMQDKKTEELFPEEGYSVISFKQATKEDL